MSLKQSLLDLQLSQTQFNAGLFLLGGYISAEAALSEYDKKFGLVRDASGQFAKKAGNASDKAVSNSERNQTKELQGDSTTTKDFAKEISTMGSSLKKSIAQLSDNTIGKAQEYLLSEDFKDKSNKVMDAVDKIDKAAGDAFRKVHEAYTRHIDEANKKEASGGLPKTKAALDRARKALDDGIAKGIDAADGAIRNAGTNLPGAIGAFCGVALMGGSLQFAAAVGIGSLVFGKQVKEAFKQMQLQKAMDKAKRAIDKAKDSRERDRMRRIYDITQKQLDRIDDSSKAKSLTDPRIIMSKP